MEEIEQIDVVIKVFSEAKSLKKGQSKTIKCPICNGNINISKSGYNGHIWAKCETKNCVNIIQ